MTPRLKKRLIRILIAAGLFIALFTVSHLRLLNGFPKEWILVGCAVAVYLFAGYDVLIRAGKNIVHGKVFDENFLMVVATIAAFAIGEYEEAVAVMVFYQLGEWFQDYAVGKSRGSIADLMSIAPDYANVERDGTVEEIDPEDVEIGDVLVVKAGEKVPVDGIVQSGDSFLDTSSLTGESVPRAAHPGDAIVSGAVNGSGTLRIQATKRYEDSTVAKILELVENASSSKAKTEKFITRFAKYYTPTVTIAAVLLAVIPPLLFHQPWGEWIRRACTFLVISCPCAVVISVPLGFFGGIGAASKAGVLVKGSNYLEMLAKVRTMAFDKTGTLTCGAFEVTGVFPEEGVSREELLNAASVAETYSAHPIAEAIRKYTADGPKPEGEIRSEEIAGQGIRATLKDKTYYAGNRKLMDAVNIPAPLIDTAGTVVYVSEGSRYLGAVVISDSVKEGVKEALRELRASGVTRTVMLSGDLTRTAEKVASELGIDEVRSELLPAGKVAAMEKLISENGKGVFTAYVGDGINDAPVLMRSDLGIAMGSLGSDAAIEAADIVLMDDDLRKIGKTHRIARKTLRIVREDIVIALTVKFVVLCAGAFGFASMWLAIFADVGVAVLAILNSMRAMKA